MVTLKINVRIDNPESLGIKTHTEAKKSDFINIVRGNNFLLSVSSPHIL